MPKLTGREEDIARSRARAAGRPYPNPIDVSAVVRMRQLRDDDRKRRNVR
jgi:hypothetical protein